MKLLEPGRIGNFEIKNRIIMAPMGYAGHVILIQKTTGVSVYGLIVRLGPQVEPA